MDKDKVDFKKIETLPGIYIFKSGKEYLYIGKATNLKDRVKSYFQKNLNRSPLIYEMVKKAKKIETVVTDNVLDALILEAFLIKKHSPFYNTKEKDDKSFNYLVITKEDFPKVLVKRGREISKNNLEKDSLAIYGPFASGKTLREVLKLIRKSIPFRDKCNLNSKRPCFNAQINLCPGVCVQSVTKSEYKKNIKQLMLVFEGKRLKIVKDLKVLMKKASDKKEFEKAQDYKRKIYNLENINDISLIKKDHSEGSMDDFRIESYDVAHTSGKFAVGVMVVMVDGVFDKKEYRVFNIRQDNTFSDIDSLKEILERRSKRKEWNRPRLIVLDGGKAQLNAASKFLEDVPKVSVLKDEHHRPKNLLGDKVYIKSREKEILEVNIEAHRFALNTHRKKRDKLKG